MTSNTRRCLFLALLLATPLCSSCAEEESDPWAASFHFTSFPDFFNWNIRNPEPGWEQAVGWFLDRMKQDGPAFSLIAGDITDARWEDHAEQVRSNTKLYWTGFKKRFEEKKITLYVAPGDHEYGDNAGLAIPKLARVFGEQFSSLLGMPTNGPEHKKGRAFSVEQENLAVITVDTFEDAGSRFSVTVSGKQLAWFEEQLKKYQDKEFIIVQGHAPVVVGPINTSYSSGLMLEGGTNSEFWKMMVKYGVDAYFCGEHHAFTATQEDGIWQIVHGALWGYDTKLHYLKGSVGPGRLVLKRYDFNVEYSGGSLTAQHSLGKGPGEMVAISAKTKTQGPTLAGQLVIEVGSDGKKRSTPGGVFTAKVGSKDGGKVKPDGGIKNCKEGQVYRGKGSRWVCKNGKWVKESVLDGGASSIENGTTKKD